jgi:hypothetical protein
MLLIGPTSASHSLPATHDTIQVRRGSLWYQACMHYIRIRGYIRGYTPTSRIFDADIILNFIRGYIPEDISFLGGIYPPRGYIRGYIPLRGYIPPKKGYILGDISSGIYPRKGIYPFPKGIYPTLKRIGYIPERGYIPFPKGIYLASYIDSILVCS